jgi:ABC-type Fe3+/spermidine/putrescine transport system ATPase subunit
VKSILCVRDIYKQFEDGVGVLRGVSIDVDRGQIACLLGPSGCGKTTLLRVIAGLETPDRGQVRFDEQDMLPVPVHKRGFGLMFQDYALFPHQDVAANVAFGLRMQGLPRDKIERRVQDALELVNLQALAHRDVHQLSGGEQQRVALARSLAPQPRLLMLDEPIGALDRTLRDRLLEELRDILKQVGVTVLYVTHDQSEAFAVADRVILMYQGRIVQVGAPEAVYRQPVNAWAARFLGMHNLLSGEWLAPGLVETSIGPLQIDGNDQGRTIVLIRPEAASVGQTGAGTVVSGTLVSRSFRGALVHVGVQCAPDRILSFDLPAGTEIPDAGQPIALTIKPAGIVCLREKDI